jgi:hypothetical protein
MSIRDRLDDARVLYANGRRDGALLSALIAVAATSRRRYHDATDRQAFIRFLLDEHPALIPSSDWVPKDENDYIRSIEPSRVLDENGDRVGGYWFQVPGCGKWGWPDEMMPLAACLYYLVRNSLAHEATLPENVEFVESGPGVLVFEILENRLRLSHGLIDGLARAVTYAPENFDLFPDIADMPEDVAAWMLFGVRRGKRDCYLAQRAERVARARKVMGTV